MKERYIGLMSGTGIGGGIDAVSCSLKTFFLCR